MIGLTPAQVDAPKLEDIEKIVSFRVEGTVTEANYDASSGTIETYEGETFALDTTAGDSSAVRWPDDPADVHYMCNGSGDCTLIRAGGIVRSARRIATP
ncbi:MAG TPA: hypothetical protein VN829_23300 [Dongiaceae bacterium]|nr:hypothetical protein [Dongiaceae bacterium]